MTAEQKRRIIEAIIECERVLDRAQSYQLKFQDVALISQYEGHKAKLQGMLS